MGTALGTFYVRRAVHIAAGPTEVWEDFTTFDRFAAWFDRGHRLLEYAPVVGGSVRLDVEIDGERRPFGGRVRVFEPARELTFDDNWEDAPWPAPTFLTFRLTALYGGTLVELFHHGFERLGERAGDEHAAYERAWDLKHLLALRARHGQTD